MGRAPSSDKSSLKKGPWTAEEDQKLTDYIQKHGYGNWRTLPKNAGLQRCGKSCRLRWTNYLRPDIKRGRFSFEEEETIIQLHSILGNKWSAIAARLPGRTDNEIKNYWNTNIRKRLLRMGIDPVTHSPRPDLLDLSSILRSTLYNNSHMNFLSKSFSGAHLLINPELLRVAVSLQASSSQHDQNQNFQLLQNQYDPMQTRDQEISFSNDAQIMDQFYRQNFNDFCNQGEMPSNLTGDDYVPLRPSYETYYATLDQDVFGSSSETLNFQTCNVNSFGFPSELSTPLSSPTTLNSNSTCIISSNTEDEREISNTFKFEIPDLLDVSDYL